MANQNPKMRRFPRGRRPVAKAPLGSTFSIMEIILQLNDYHLNYGNFVTLFSVLH